MSLKTVHKKYYIFNPSLKIIPVESYQFNTKSDYNLKVLVNDECTNGGHKSNKKNIKVEKMINEMGFDWEPLSEPGQMKQMPYAATIIEAIEKNIWKVVEQFSNEQCIPIHRISGGELYSSDQPEFRKQLLLISKNPELYGTNHYRVNIQGKKQILRFSSCTQKLSVSKKLNLNINNLPLGLFEISKSYRFEEEDELQLCKRVRSFHLPELHLLTKSFHSSLVIAKATHQKILKEIKKFDSNFELLCSVSDNFFRENKVFLFDLVKSINKPLLLAVYKGASCEDGINLDVEYKVFDTAGLPVEIATFQIDDGTADSAFNIRYQKRNNRTKPVSTMHIVFPFSSLERSAYFFLDRAIKEEIETGFKAFPFWVVPIQARVIAYNKSSLKYAIKLTEELNSLNFRTDLDDREMHYNVKKREKDLKWIPYIITIKRTQQGSYDLLVEIKQSGAKVMHWSNLIKEMETNESRRVIVPRYFPMLLSQRLTMK